MRTVVAALITLDGKLLICQRRRDDTFPLRWEFPGGKLEAGESLEQALARELREELGISVVIGQEAYRTVYLYQESQDELTLVFFCTALHGDSPPPRNLVFESFEWIAPSELPRFDFLAADRELTALLVSGAICPSEGTG